MLPTLVIVGSGSSFEFPKFYEVMFRQLSGLPGAIPAVGLFTWPLLNNDHPSHCWCTCNVKGLAQKGRVDGFSSECIRVKAIAKTVGTR